MLAEAPRVGKRESEPDDHRLFSASINTKDIDKVKALVEAGADVNNSDLGTHWPSTGLRD